MSSIFIRHATDEQLDAIQAYTGNKVSSKAILSAALSAIAVSKEYEEFRSMAKLKELELNYKIKEMADRIESLEMALRKVKSSSSELARLASQFVALDQSLDQVIKGEDYEH